MGGQAGGVAVVGGEASFFGGLLAVCRRLNARLRSGKFSLHCPLPWLDFSCFHAGWPAWET